MTKSEAIHIELVNYNSVKIETARKIISLLKDDCTTYFDLEDKFSHIERAMIWDGSAFEDGGITTCIKRLIEEEKSGLHIADRQ